MKSIHLIAFPKVLRTIQVAILLIVGCWALLGSGVSPAWAGLQDDHYDGNIFALYGGNGSIVPPRMTLADSLKRNQPALVVYYLDDSRDCKEYAVTVSRIQAFYGRAANLIALNVDAFEPNVELTPTDPAYYYQGAVPQLVVFNQAGEAVLNEVGQVPYEHVDDVFREVFDLLPRSESLELKRRSLNEVNVELTP